MNKKYKLNKEWLDLLLESKNNENITFNLSNNDTKILLTYIEILQQENQELKLELSGYRQAILKDKEMLGLKEENKKYKQVIDKAINGLNIIIDIVRELPLGSDCWVIDRLEANKSILKEAE